MTCTKVVNQRHVCWILYSCSFVGAVVSSLVRGLDRDLAIKAGLRAAYASLHSPQAVSEEVNPSFLVKGSIATWAPWTAVQLYRT